MKTDHFDGLYWYNTEDNKTIFDDYTNHYNIPKIHNQRYTFIGKWDCGFYIIVPTKILIMYLH